MWEGDNQEAKRWKKGRTIGDAVSEKSVSEKSVAVSISMYPSTNAGQKTWFHFQTEENWMNGTVSI
jgi:hypothetical protein